MHNLANSFPEMGQGILAVAILGAVSLLSLAALTMIYSALRLVWARIGRGRTRKGPIPLEVRARLRVPVR